MIFSEELNAAEKKMANTIDAIPETYARKRAPGGLEPAPPA
jgi:hypothetical protein